MDIVVTIHSIVRFVILAVAVAGILVAVVSFAQKNLPEKLQPTLASIFVGLYDLQALLGILIILLGGLTQAIHPLVMLIGVLMAHALQNMTRRTGAPNVPLYRLALFVVPLVIILVGVASIGHLPV